MEKIKNSKTFPDTQHYAIILFDTRSVYHEADQRSKDFPGHGYPAHTETFDNFEYLAFNDNSQGRIEWEQKVKDLHSQKKEFVAFMGQPKAELKPELSINIKS